jgi:hypothetical protein
MAIVRISRTGVGNVTFEEVAFAAAKTANEAVVRTMRDYGRGFVTDEDDISPYLLGRIADALEGWKDGPEHGVRWTASIIRHRRGEASEDHQTGADIMIHVSLDTPTEKYSKGALIQAKRFEPGERMTIVERTAMRRQCEKILRHSPAAFIFDYAKSSMRVGSASRILGAEDRVLHSICGWTSYRFLLELFRCPIGDTNLRSAYFRDLPDPPHKLFLTATGAIDAAGAL